MTTLDAGRFTPVAICGAADDLDRVLAETPLDERSRLWVESRVGNHSHRRAIRKRLIHLHRFTRFTLMSRSDVQ